MTTTMLNSSDVMSKEINSPETFDANAFVPKEYLQQYFTELEQDEALLIEWQSTLLTKRIGESLVNQNVEKFPLHIDAGSGPTLHHLISLSKFSEVVKVMDFIEGNVLEVHKWLGGDKDAHDWSHFTSAILKSEGIRIPDEYTVQAREAATREKVVLANPGLLSTDAKETFEPFDLKHPRPWMRQLSGSAQLVTSFYVADSCTDNVEEFSLMTRNVFDLVAPGGLFAASYLGGCKGYAVGNRMIKSANLTEEDVRLALKAAGADDIDIVRYETPENIPEGFDHIFAVSAVKPLK